MTKAEAYRELGIAEGSSLDEVRTAYLKLAKQWHPDKHRDDGGSRAAEVVFQRITVAYRAICESDFDAPARPSAPSAPIRPDPPKRTVTVTEYPYVPYSDSFHPDAIHREWQRYRRKNKRSTFDKIVEAPGDFIDWLID